MDPAGACHYTGQSFRSYVNQFRIAKAQDLLASTDEPISSISQAVAFCNQSYFGMMFRKLVGSTPLAYRRQFASGHETEHPATTPSPAAARSLEAQPVQYTVIKKVGGGINHGALMVR
ncbi:MAG: helix-turn-helix domain-containing protein [Terriglobia bacterium]